MDVYFCYILYYNDIDITRNKNSAQAELIWNGLRTDREREMAQKQAHRFPYIGLLPVCCSGAQWLVKKQSQHRFAPTQPEFSPAVSTVRSTRLSVSWVSAVRWLNCDWAQPIWAEIDSSIPLIVQIQWLFYSRCTASFLTDTLMMRAKRKKNCKLNWIEWIDLLVC